MTSVSPSIVCPYVPRRVSRRCVCCETHSACSLFTALTRCAASEFGDSLLQPHSELTSLQGQP
eukprot:3339161-Amphidinium_carterae.1